MELEFGVRTDKEKVRAKNEDAYYVDSLKGLFMVADGLGGHQAGEVASSMAVHEAVRFLGTEGITKVSEEFLRASVWSANLKVYMESLKDESLLGMGTTLVIALIREAYLWLAHVGESRAYFISEEGLRQLTNDHALIYELSHRDFFTPYRFSPVLTRAVGTAPSVERRVRSWSMQPMRKVARTTSR
jgi:serine/threonine protein phosphatase PrpC